mmetsp:Transcript_46740/g.75282  ORF Transcript_46740/g.75282 Transcript_46740/m.75282 type:complete len:444 (-) Transcript_46740:6-1337(-)
MQVRAHARIIQLLVFLSLAVSRAHCFFLWSSLPARAQPSASASTMSLIDVNRAREETRGCCKQIHLNNAGASLLPSTVVDAYVAYIKQEEDEGGYEVEARRRGDLEAFYSATAELLNCQEDEVAFVESASRGWALALYSLPLKQGDRIITSAADYGSNFISFLQARDKWGAEIVVIDDDARGDLDMDMLRCEAANARARVICMTHIPTGGGRIIDAKIVGEIAEQNEVPFFLDACQSVGMMQVDVLEYKCQVLTATGRKFLRGPRGTGLLYISNSFIDQLDPVMLDQHGALLTSEHAFTPRIGARRFEMWESNCGGKVALGIAIRYALSYGINSGAIEKTVVALAAYLRSGLRELPRVTCHDIGSELGAIVTFTVKDMTADQVKEELKKVKINASVSAAASGGSRVWYDRRGLDRVVRLAPHYYNTEAELDQVVNHFRSMNTM